MSSIINTVFIRSWWVVLFILFCYVCYEQGLRKRDVDFAKLHAQYIELLDEKQRALTKNEDLQMQINSHNDPEWVEMTLMKGLGLVPEGQTKVLFTDNEELLNPKKK
jgi:hypothetical protein